MECWQCGRQVRQGAKLCIYCGADLTHNGGAFEPEPPAQRGSSYVENESEELPRPGRGSSRGGPRAVPRDPFDDPRAPGASRSSRRDDYDDYGQGRSSSRANGPDERRRSSSSGNHERDRDRRAGQPVRADDERSGYRGDWQGDGSREGSARANRRPEGRAGGRGRAGGYDDAYADDRRGGYDAYDAYDARERHGGRGGRDGHGRGQPDPYANSPIDDSWNLPALADQASEEGWAVDGGPGWGDAPGRLPSAGSPPGRGAAGSRSTRRRGSGSGSGRVVVIALVVAIALAMIAGGVVAGPRLLARLGGTAGGASATHPFATYTPGPTPTPIAKFKEFVSTQSHFVVNYPADWSSPSPQNDTSHGQYDYIDTLSKADPYMRVIVEQAQSFDAATDQQIIQGEVTGGQTTGLTFTATASGAASTNVGGEQWTRKEFDVTQANQPTLHMVILSCHHAGHGYALLLAAQSTGFAQTYTSTFQKVLSSFRFSK